jgi:hypothetical protein
MDEILRLDRDKPTTYDPKHITIELSIPILKYTIDALRKAGHNHRASILANKLRKHEKEQVKITERLEVILLEAIK